MPNNGKIAAKVLLEKLLAARALAAYRGYASTKNVQVPENERNTLHKKLAAAPAKHRI